ncbi:MULTISPECIES: ABC transporter substrate-binding protein [Streptomyces]|jgi:alpha-glucoside transport system substrate-binding protein|uniref:Extracellular solute-binding protein n=1 Tax=Streptomyces thermoviolaceus subsp. thermoviolaceus TaxID=66860 RepID=A0ABX0YYP0_STRTL|nr:MULTISPECIES: extracellular solute-binding protein [Streptomyces]MCM3265487.1 extracellular solute-binding protein [Streptomyces thermoviolaceus]NJP16178.1 extracellular solute-binding protein [Streptomyces thermoviolaceus subsp. thermoviolaceus]RSS00302.1 extracellular solute-binding protein [Streptomyces sp. WAC00469]WTD49013.1 extracellular solute-binding protein [Streptomyces thermoviolaceus]GGV74052.1 sugar ABC transporter substrate-binding protein [Streptomyces thermoviolaceus subsp. 
MHSRTTFRTHRTRRAARAAAAVAAGALALSLTACSGSDDDGKGGGDSSGSPTTNTVALPKLDGAHLEIAAVWTGAEQKNFKQVLAEFEKRTGAKVTFVPAQDPIINFLGSKIAGGQPPDVALLPQPGAIKQAVDKGWAKPLGPEAQAELEKNYSQGWQDIGKVDGKPYGVYYKAANKSLIWYNAKVFENAGVSEPKTWKDLLNTAQTIYDSGVTPFSVGGADGWTLTDWFENIYLSQAGPEKYDQLAQHKIKWTDPSVKQALTTLAEIFSKKDYIAGGPDGALQTEFPASVTQTFTGGDQPKAGMVFEGDFAQVNIGETKAKVGTDAKVFPFPAVGDTAPVVSGGDAAVILKDSKAAQALVTFLASPDAATIQAKLGGYLSPNKNVPESAYPNEVQRKIAKALIASGDDFRFDMSDQAPQAFGGTPGKGEWKDLQDFLQNPTDVAGTQARLEKDAAAAYGNGS